MQKPDDIISILNAVNEINLHIKKKNNKNLNNQNFPRSRNDVSSIPPDVDRLIIEAEEYKKNKLSAVPIKHFDEIKKKVDHNDDALILNNEIIEDENIYKKSIKQLNQKLITSSNTEKKLRIEIIDLQQEITLLVKKKNRKIESENHVDFEEKTREALSSIYKQVENQKKLYIELKEHSIKVEKDSSVFKENYERLIIENNEIKTRLAIAKEQIVNYETNKLDLISAFNQLNQTLSKSNIVGKINSNKSLSEDDILNNKKKIEIIE